MGVEQVTEDRVSVVEVQDDRCCRRKCDARAFVFAQFKTGGLGWCGHHGTEQWDAITAQALVVIDNRDQILPRPVPVES
jgi:hypothetical protein